ncbi:hypothetical protein DJ84_18290 [Halorubrum ezzemoulense]|nr:hypothetical protein DJ84_18290 [Halorubrum ezzemoulense]
MSEAARAPAGNFGKRAAKALTESMTVLDDSLDHDLRDEEFLVVTATGTYRVDAIADSCDCPDALHRAPDKGCKHRLRVALARGERPIPGWVDRSAIDEQLGQHLAASPLIATADGSTEVFEQ